MQLQYIGKKPKLFFDPPWLVGGPYIFDRELDDATCEVHDADGEALLEYSPGSFRVVGPSESAPELPAAEGKADADPPEDGKADADPPEDGKADADPPEDGKADADPPEAEDKPFKCFVCGFTCKSQSALTNHIRKTHPEVGAG